MYILGWFMVAETNGKLTVDSRYYNFCYNEILLITIPNLYPNHSQTIEIQTGYIDSLVGYIDTFSLSRQYRNNESLLYYDGDFVCKATTIEIYSVLCVLHSSQSCTLLSPLLPCCEYLLIVYIFLYSHTYVNIKP
jgi:hypothetical protein